MWQVNNLADTGTSPILTLTYRISLLGMNKDLSYPYSVLYVDSWLECPCFSQTINLMFFILPVSYCKFNEAGKTVTGICPSTVFTFIYMKMKYLERTFSSLTVRHLKP